MTAAKPSREVRFVAAPGFRDQYRYYLALHPEIAESIAHFNTLKRKIPPEALPAKMKDHKLDEPLDGIKECHLADDVLLLYVHENDVVQMLYLCRHEDLKAKRQRQLAATVRTLIKKHAKPKT